MLPLDDDDDEDDEDDDDDDDDDEDGLDARDPAVADSPSDNLFCRGEERRAPVECTSSNIDNACRSFDFFEA